MSAIAIMYADKVLKGEKTIEEVPERWRQEVIDYINSLN